VLGIQIKISVVIIFSMKDLISNQEFVRREVPLFTAQWNRSLHK